MLHLWCWEYAITLLVLALSVLAWAYHRNHQHRRDNGSSGGGGVHVMHIATWNVLGKGYCRAEVFPQSKPEEIEFPLRIERMEKILHHELAVDIVCLQEVDFDVPLAKGRYEFAYAKRSRKKKDGCLIAWEKKRYRKRREEIVEFNRLSLLGLERRRMMRDNIALIVELEISRSKSVIVVNTHLYYHPEYENVRLLQTRYLLQRVEEFKKLSSAQDTFVVVCGDFNTLPNSSVYNYVVTGRLDASSTVLQKKLLLEGDLNKLSKWLRMLGIDVVYIRTNGVKDYQTLIDQARAEDRIVVSRNKRLTDRRDCTRYILIPSKMSHEDALRYIVNSLGTKIEDDQFFSRCVICNSPAVPVSIEDAKTYDEYPDDVEEEVQLLLKFFNCSTCKKLLWWGPKSYFTIDDLKKMLATPIFDEKEDEIGAETKEDLIPEVSVSQLHNLELVSSHVACKGMEPAFTNFTFTFEGTLDYIFFCDDSSRTSKVRCVKSETFPQAKDVSPLPTVNWPSDHLAVRSTFHITL
eukprot:TRINITY_DN34377_c0_g1_i2.p1 TRINITY_DN34377_c0_g1~~TRINITY_DN34377_c0_g1_i2.p1  ORF type:complete len:520 (-),score=119.69 TRINITY_DN34377_c0_g1_i2:35-1594(-)